MNTREKFSSRLGFLLISAGCAVGLGNVWRFPYITGQYGGAAFVLIYLVFLILLGLPIMTMEYSVGRASQKSAARSFEVLEPEGTKWHFIKLVPLVGNYMLMMFYTTVGGWMLAYFFKTAAGSLGGKNAEQINNAFSGFLASPSQQVLWMLVVTVIGFFICSRGLRNGVEKISKYMMGALFVVMLVLVVHSFLLSGAKEGLAFYLIPDFGRALENYTLGEIIFAALGQAFFTLSLGIGALAIFGSYIGKDHSLVSESLNVVVLDTLVALFSGLIIFPACFTYNIDAGSGPGLIFVTLPATFNEMAGGRVWGSLFFAFMAFAALTTIIAVFENIVAFAMDFGWSRKKAVAVNAVAVILLSLPCALGFNLLSGFQPFGAGSTVQNLEDFIVSNTLLPLGSLLYLLFCTYRYGWGWKKYSEEVNCGKGLKLPNWTRGYISYVLPLIVIFILVDGYLEKLGFPANYLLPVFCLIYPGYLMVQSYLVHRKKMGV
ncbi:sodium-dependent transporter [Extibacter muris]|uniref:sodium-dependent transporter n=1 Tax=Extibacter muris TaxID=1796622 RepID=UPI001D074A02|nr:sodium-dependent transporter [Extibacter muris]MCB6200727.1 sodium-dependent transporter [Extibacter muris]MCQ4665429.1 sodium-dependent transporter [Extibacter muris]MCQ4694774.1 sodium-dependent transporter [Extibacter muris]